MRSNCLRLVLQNIKNSFKGDCLFAIYYQEAKIQRTSIPDQNAYHDLPTFRCSAGFPCKANNRPAVQPNPGGIMIHAHAHDH